MKNTITGLLAVAIAAALPGIATGVQPEHVRGAVLASAQTPSAPIQRLIVNYREGSPARHSRAQVVQTINRALARSGLSAQILGGGNVSYLRKLATGHALVKLPIAVDRASARQIMQQISADRDVVSVEMDEIVQIAQFPEDPPNDPFYQNYQWHFHAPDGNTHNIDNIANRGGANVAEAWKLADGSGITVAVIDTGVVAHEDIDTSLAEAGYDFITDTWRSGRDSDDRVPGAWDLGDWTIDYPGAENCIQWWSTWHGTHVAGTVGAELTNNGMGVAGIAHAAKVLHLRALGHCGGLYSDVVDAIVWASGGDVPGMPANQNPAHVINMSLGSMFECSDSTAYALAIADARSRGTVVVAAAGNDNADAGNHSPSSCPGVISVAATTIDSSRAYYSNYGQRVDISAPAGNNASNWTDYVVQAKNGSQTAPEPGNDGTSMAAPHVAGVVALMQSARLAAGQELLTPDEVLAYLQETATAFAVAPPPEQPIGAGIVNAAAAVIRATCDDCVPPPPSATPIFNNTPIKGLSGGSETWVLTVPAGAKGPLSVLTNGGSGDLTLLVNKDEAPENNAAWSWRSARRGNNETVRIHNLPPGEYYIRLMGEPRPYSGVSLRAIHK